MELSKLKVWIQCARPKTLPAAIAPVMIGSAMALSDGQIHIITLIVTFAAALLIQIATNFANDYYDFIKGADTEHRTGPTRGTAAGLVQPSQMKKAFIITFATAIILGGYLVLKGGVPILIIGVSSVICGILYTAGPFPLGYIGLGELFVIIFFGPVAVAGTYYLQRANVTTEVILAGISVGLLSSAILAVNNLRDIATDKLAGKKTLIVRFGRNFGIAEYLFCIISACLIAAVIFICRGSYYMCLILLVTLITALRPMKTVCSSSTPEQLNKVLAQTGAVLIIFSILFSIGMLI